MSEIPATYHFVEIARSNDVSRRSADRENSARPAVVEYIHQSTGLGQHRVKTAIVFPVIFKNEPHLATGSTVVHNPNHKIYNDPRGSSGVYAWQTDARGFYIGAFIWVRVDMDRIPDAPTANGASTTYAAATLELAAARDYLAATTHAVVEHHLTFCATAFKDLPTSTLDPALTPRNTGVGA